MRPLSRRAVLGGMGALSLAACSAEARPTPHGGHATTPIPTPAALTPRPGQQVVEMTLRPQVSTIDLGGAAVETWTYDGTAPGPLLRARVGDLVRVRVDNQLPEETTVHWHGIRIRNAADGIPHVTQDPIAPGASYLYEWEVPDPGTYWYHSHVGLQLDRGLYAPLVIDDPDEPGAYDEEWVVVLDDWIDGTGQTPDDVMRMLIATGSSTGERGGHSHGGDMGGMGGTGHDHGGHGSGDTGSGGKGMGAMTDPPWGHSDVAHPHFLVNGRTTTDPEAFRGRPGQRVRIRIVNAAADTIFSVGLADHRMTVTHTDGWPVRPREVSSLFLGMGERYDVVVTLRDGVFPLVAKPFGKAGVAGAFVVTAGTAASATVPDDLPELRKPLIGTDLAPAASALLPEREVDDTQMLHLTGQMQPYTWEINGAPHGFNEALVVREGERVQFGLMNMTDMTHPMHVHGHTFALPNGLRKDTVLVRPMEMLDVRLDADNPGRWMWHCHNGYHQDGGMMIDLDYA